MYPACPQYESGRGTTEGFSRPGRGEHQCGLCQLIYSLTGMHQYRMLAHVHMDTYLYMHTSRPTAKSPFLCHIHKLQHMHSYPYTAAYHPEILACIPTCSYSFMHLHNILLPYPCTYSLHTCRHPCRVKAFMLFLAYPRHTHSEALTACTQTHSNASSPLYHPCT